MLNTILHAGVSSLGVNGLAVVLGLIAGLLVPFIKKGVIAAIEAVKTANTRLGKVSPIAEAVAEMGEKTLFAAAIQHKAAIEATAARLNVPVSVVEAAITQIRDSEQQILGFSDPSPIGKATVVSTSTTTVTSPPTVAQAQSNPVAPAQVVSPESADNSIPPLGTFGPTPGTNPTE